MKNSRKNYDPIREWVESTDRDQVSDGFKHNLMSRIELEPLSSLKRYNKPVSKWFKWTSITGFAMAFISSVSLLDLDLTISSAPARNLLNSISLPEINYPDLHLEKIMDNPIIIYVTILIASGLLFDYFLRTIFTRTNKKRA